MASKQPAMSPSELPNSELIAKLPERKQADAQTLLELHQELTGEQPVVWAGRIIGFGEVTYRYESGHSGRMPLLAFAPGAARHTIYLEAGFAELWPELLEKLGKYKASKACLYLTNLASVDLEVLRELLIRSLAKTCSQWGEEH